jgi:uncharacterized SAM-binding protein YcdF (DUF218 family)
MRRNARSIWKWVVLLIIIIPMVGILGVLVAIAIFGWTSQPNKADCIVILGASVYGTTPSPVLQARIDEGLRLYREGYAPLILVSGAQGKRENISEAEAMRRSLVSQGVPDDRILVDDRSGSTWENILFSQQLMQQKGLKSAIIVSNRYHLLRSCLMAQRLGLDASYSGIFLSDSPNTEATGFIREGLAIVAFFFGVK